MDPEVILAVGSLLIGGSGALIGLWTYVNTARTGEIDRLEKRLARVEEENQGLHKEMLTLREENMWLRLVLANKGIEIPPMPNKRIASPE